MIMINEEMEIKKTFIDYTTKPTFKWLKNCPGGYRYALAEVLEPTYF